MALGDIFGMLKEAIKDWSEDNAPRLAAALSYYTIFSIAPLLLISIALAGLVFGQEAAQGRIVTQIQGLVGGDAAEAIEAMLQNARKPGQGVMATILGLATLLFGAGGAFNELRAGLNAIWEIPPRRRGGIKALTHERLLSFAMVLVVGFLLLVSLIMSAALTLLEVKGKFPGSGVVLQILNNAVSLAVITVLFALIYKYLPDEHPRVAGKDIWAGAFITAALFTLGKFAIGLYLGRSSIASAYGAAGSVVLLLVWVYYSAQILFFGAEVTQVLARRHGSRLGQSSDASGATAASAKPSAAMAAGRTAPATGRAPSPDRPAASDQPAEARALSGETAPPPTSAVGKGLAWSAALLLLGSIQKKRRWTLH